MTSPRPVPGSFAELPPALAVLEAELELLKAALKAAPDEEVLRL